MINKKSLFYIDIIFIGILLCFVFVPVFFLQVKDEILFDIRNPTPMPQLFDKGRKNTFGKEFDKYFSDRFFLRTQMIRAYFMSIYILNRDYVPTMRVYFYKSNSHFFFKRERGLAKQSFSTARLEKISSNLNTFNEFCKRHNIKLYIAVMPSWTNFYKTEDLKRKVLLPENIKQLVDYSKEKYDLNIIYPLKELNIARKNDYVYFKTDHHLTDYGSYISYQVIMKQIAKDFKGIKATQLSDFKTSKNNFVRADNTRKFNEGWAYKISGFKKDERVLQSQYTYYDYKYPERINISNTITWEHSIFTNSTGNHKVFVIGDSFMENLIYFFITNFKQVARYRFTDSSYPKRRFDLDIKAYEKLILEFKPDIIVLVTNTDNVSSNLGEMYRGDE
jgi:hypothetical protein